MPDKDYIKKVYNFMTSAYGEKGALSPGAFRGSFDDFYNKVSTNEKYADKIQKALSIAYGANGALKKGAFGLDPQRFRGRVLTSVEKAPDLVAEPPHALSDMEDPVTRVLSTGTSIETPTVTEPGLLGDIRTFEPLIQETERTNQEKASQDLARAERYLLDGSATVSMTSPTAQKAAEKVLNTPEGQYRLGLTEALRTIDEEDNNRLAAQAVADELYKTPQGRFYYDFIRPVYKTAVESGKNIAATGARLFDADKTAEKIVDYFDFDRLAREGNVSSALNIEPTKQKGKLGMNNIVPKTAEALTNMGVLMAGGALGAGKGAIMGTSFLTQYENYRQEAKVAGLSDAEADKYALTGAGLTSMLELVSPNEFILKGTTSSLSNKSVFNAIKSGIPVATALKAGLKDGLKEIGKENAQEMAQLIGDNVVKFGFDKYVLNDPRFSQENILPTAQQALETIVLTTIATGAISSPRLVSKHKVSSLERSAWATAAENPQIIEDALGKAVAEGQITQGKADELKQNVADYKSLYDALAVKGYDKDIVERMAINAYRARKIDEQNKPIAGIQVLNAITSQDEATKADIEKDILSAAAGEPESDYDQAILEDPGNQPTGITVQQPSEITRPQVITVGENITEPKAEENAIQIESPEGMDVRQQARNGEGVVEGNTEGQITPSESIQIQQPEREEEVTTHPPSSLVPEEIKIRRDNARDRLKSAWDAYKAVGIISDPEKNLKRDKEFYSALTNYVKEEIFYRANQVEGFARQKKAQIKRAISKSLKEEGISFQDVSMLNDAFEEAYQQAKKIPGVLPPKTDDRVSYKQYIKDRIKVREAGRISGVRQGRKEMLEDVNERLSNVRKAISDVLKESDTKLPVSQVKKISSILQNAANSGNIETSINTAVDRVSEIINKSNKDYIKERILIREAGKRKGFSEGKKEGLAEGKVLGTEIGIRKGVKEGAQAAKLKMGAVRAAIQEVLSEENINLSMQQKRSIISMLQTATTSKDIGLSIDRAVSAVTQMVWEAKNKGKIAAANRAIKAIGKLKKSKSMVLQDIEWIKGLNLPTASKVDDLDTYLDMLKDFTQSRKGNELNPKYTKEGISEFVDQENDRIYKEKRESQQADLDELKEQGIIPDDVTLDEYIGMLDGTPNKASEGISPKAEILKNSLKGRLGMLKARLFEFEGQNKTLVSELSNIDPSYLNAADLVRLNNVLNNIAEFGTLDSAGDILTSYKAKKANEELERSKEKLRELPAMNVLNKKNLSNFMSALFYNDNAISNFREKTIGLIERKVSNVKNQAQNVVEEFVQLNRRNKIDGLSNNKLHVFSYLNQYRGNDPGEIADDLKRRLDDLVSDARYVLSEANRVEGKAGDNFRREAMHRFESMADLGLIDYSINEMDPVDDLMVTIKEEFDNPEASLREIEGRLSQGQKEVYQFARDHYDALTDQLEDVTRNYAGKAFQRERNYISLVPRKKRAADDKNPEISADTDILEGLKSVNAKPSSTTISRSAKKPDNIYYESDFFSNFINRYYTSLYTAKALPELQTVAKTVNDAKFEKFLTGQFDEGFRGLGKDNFQKFKSKIAEAINEEKYSPFFKKDKSNMFDEVVNKGVRLVLGNVWQAPKQYVPALLHNLVVNNISALRYAIKSRGLALSPYNKEYALARQELLNHFTGVQRSAVGSNAYDEYIKRIDEDMAWWQHPLEWLDKVRSLSSFVLEKADKAAQNDAYIASYITSLLKDKKIKKLKDFNLYEHAKNPDQKALAYAEQIASNINNESARAYRPKVLKDPVSARNLWLLQGFALNAYQNAINKAKIIVNNRATGIERREAANHLAGYLAELASYQLVGKWARNLQGALAVALLSAWFGVKPEEDKEAKKQRKIKENIKMGANMAADIALSGLPAPYQTAAKLLINYGYGEWAKIWAEDAKKEAKEKGEKFDPRGTYLSPYFKPFVGAEGPGGAAEFYTSAGQKAIDAVVKAANEKDESKEDTETEKLMANLNRYLGIPAVVLGSGDLFVLNNRMQQALREKKASDKKKEKENISGSGQGKRRSAIRNTYNR